MKLKLTVVYDNHMNRTEFVELGYGIKENDELVYLNYVLAFLEGDDASLIMTRRETIKKIKYWNNFSWNQMC